MSAAIAGFTPTTPPASGSTTTGLNSMSSSDFLNLMITQLQQQDPLNPSSSDQLMSQMSEIKQMQSSDTLNNTLGGLNTSLSGLSLQQSISAAGNLIGKQIKGTDPTGVAVSGTVNAVTVQNKAAYLTLDNGATVSMDSVTDILPAGSAVTPAAPAS